MFSQKTIAAKILNLPLILFIVQIGFGQNPTTLLNQDITTLETAKPIERKISADEKHLYQINSGENKYTKIVIEQKEVNIYVRLIGADGNLVTTFNNEVRLKENEIVEVVTTQKDNYRIEIQPTAKNASGIYKINLTEVRDAAERDRNLFEAQVAVEKADDLLGLYKYEEAFPFAARALEIAEKELDADDIFVARAMITLGGIQTRRGNYPAALALLQRAVVISEKSLSIEHPQFSNSLFALGLYYRLTGDFVKAERLYRQVLEVRERTLGKDHEQVEPILNNLGNLLNSLGDNVQAENYLLRAMAIAEKTIGSESTSMGNVVNNLGVLYLDRKDYERAEEYFQRVLKIYEKTLGTETSYYSNILQNLGIIYRNRKDYKKASEFYERALVIREKALGKEHSDIGFLLNNMANIYKANGDYMKALELQRRVRYIAEKTVGQYHTLTLTSLGNTATIYAAQDDISNAVSSQKLYDDRFEKVISLDLTIGSERQKLAYTNVFPGRTSRTISLHINLAKGDQTAVDAAALVVLRRKGRVLDAVAANLTALRERANAEDQELLQRFNSVTAQLAKLTLSKPAKLSSEEYQKQLTDLETQKEKLEIQISDHNPQSGIGSSPVTLAAIKAEIPADAALIEFAVYQPFNPKAENNDEAYGEARYIAYILRKSGEVKFIELGDKKTIDKSSEELRKALRDKERKDIKQIARKVDGQLMQPIRALLGNSQKLLISPEGDLNLIPFEALLDEKGKYLIEKFSFSYLTSGRDLLRMKTPRPDKGGFSIIANPAFSANSEAVKPSITATRNISDTYFASLPSTMQEARSIQTLFPEAVIYSAEQASETALKELTAPRVLHIATHGFFVETFGESNKEAVSSNRSLSAGIESENPLLRSGIALAGANQRKGNKDDGILTALEASGLNLWGTKLVVLSACDTGLGEVKTGEGVYGLRRAFTLAGTESLVMSLWAVSDYVTRELMTNYYKNLKTGLGRGESLRQVQLAMMKKKEREHPFYWAAFIHSGEWANLEEKR